MKFLLPTWPRFGKSSVREASWSGLVLVGNPMSLVTGGGERALLGACSSGRQGGDRGMEGKRKRKREEERGRK